MLAPGPDGAVATYRFEAVRQGLLETEARVFVERALDAPTTKARLGAALAARAADLLRRRASLLTKASSGLQLGGPDWSHVTNARGWFQWNNTAGHSWLLSADWQTMNEELLALAAEVEAKLGAGK